MTHNHLFRLIVFTLVSLVITGRAQNLINVKLAGGTPGTPSGAAVVGTAGDVWNYFPSLGGRANGGGVVTNATTIRDSSGAALTGVAMTVSLSGGDGLDSFTDNGGFSPVPSLLMGNYTYENNGVNYWTISFTSLPPNKAYMIYGMGNGNQSGQGTTWWVDAANGHATASATANFAIGGRNATLASNEGVCWVKLPATTTASGALTFRVVRLNAAENGTGGSGRAYLNAFQLQPLSAPVISDLTNQTVVAGTSASLRPTISGIPLPAFQWRSNGTNIPGATNDSLTLPNVQFSQNGFVYSLVASNVGGAMTNSMTLSVIVTPAITGLTNQAVAIGSDVTLAATVSGVPSPALQWHKDGDILPGITSASHFIPNAQATHSGTYSLVASNSAGITTNSMTLTVSAGDVPPNITGPANQTVIQTSNATFSASVSGLPLPTLQWRANGADIPGATTSSLTISNVQYSQNGFIYSLVASNSAGLATNNATLFVLVPPAIVQQPTNLTVGINTPATFSVNASGVPAVTYQWRRNSNAIANATNASYTIASAQGSDNGAVFSVVISNSVGLVTSSNATLTVLSTMTGTFLPTNNATGISHDQQLRIVFSSTPKIGSGKLYVRDAATHALFATIDTSLFQTYSIDSATITNGYIRSVQGANYFYMPIAIYGNEAWITFSNRFAYNKTYYVNADAGLFLDSANASFPAITGTSAWRFSTKASGPATPTLTSGPTNIIVAHDGAGDFATLQGAADWVPQNNAVKRTITIQPGTYRDNTTFAQNRHNVQIIGAGTNRQAVQLFYPYPAFSSGGSSGTLRLESSDIYVRNLTLDNAVYLNYNGVTFAGRILTVVTRGNRLIFDNVLIKGGQDTLYADTGIAYFHRCEIWGSVDFIYGSALAVFDQCNIVQIRNSGGPITAPSTAQAAPYGIVFLDCTFPRALIANGYPYDVGINTTTFQRPWRKDGYTAVVNCALGSHITAKGWAEWGNRHTTCRAREIGTTLIGGGTVNVASRQSTGAYWLNTIDPDYVNDPSIDPDVDPEMTLLIPPSGPTNRIPVSINTNDFTPAAIFGHSYFNLGSWRPATLPTITAQPTNKTASAGSAAAFHVAAFGQPAPSFQWRKNGTNMVGATNATLSFASTTLADNGVYSVIVSNSAGTVTSSSATLTVPPQPTSITPGVSDSTLNLSWPQSQTGYRLLAQTNPPGVGLTTNWQTIANSNATNRISIPLVPTEGSVFFKLTYP
ncbi:MAG TPA: pectinesterase family protein [Verrucomicrobiae bacterium]|nr:pectinesterase family protein [Verrucomicrobiae bacterium]